MHRQKSRPDTKNPDLANFTPFEAHKNTPIFTPGWAKKTRETRAKHFFEQNYPQFGQKKVKSLVSPRGLNS
jgi:hypothetical protein